MKGLRQYQWLVGLLLIAFLLTGCETGHQFVKKTAFKDADKMVLTFAGPVEESWASNVGNFSAYEEPDPDIVLGIKETILSPDKTQLTIVFAAQLNTGEPHILSVLETGQSETATAALAPLRPGSAILLNVEYREAGFPGQYREYAIKEMAGIPDGIHLLAPNIMESIGNLKKETLRRRAVSLDLEETLIALSISATTNPTAQLAMEKLRELRDCQAHMTHMPTPGDEKSLRRLGVELTSDRNFSTRRLFVT